MSDRLADLDPAARRRLVRELRAQRKAARSTEPEAPDTAGSRSIPRVPGGRHPLSFAQERLWFLDQLEPGSVAYVITRGVRLDGALDLPALARALAAIVERHEVLRARFVQTGDGPVQEVVEAPGPALSLVDLAALGPERAGVVAAALSRAEGRRPFDLAADAPVRFTAVRMAPQGHALLVAIHHIVADGWSLDLLERELGVLYGAAVAGRPSPLPPLPIQYSDFSRWQRHGLDGDVLERELAHWRAALDGAPLALELPADRPRPAVASGRGATLTHRLDGDLVAAFTEVCRKRGATLFMGLLAAFATVLHRTAGGDDFLVGTDVAHRELPETQGLIGFLVNALVLRLRTPEGATFEDVLAAVRSDALAAFAHQHLPFERLVEELETERDLSRHPVFQVSLVLQTAAGGAAGKGRVAEGPAGGLGVGRLPTGGGNARYDLMIEAGPLAAAPGAGGGLELLVEYATDLFDQTTVHRLVRHLGRAVVAVAATPGGKIAELPLLAAGERHQLLREWNDAARELPGAGEPGGFAFPALFARQVAATPESMAVACRGARRSYRELAADARALAGALARRGVAPGDVVPLLAERGIAFVTAVLALFELGAAYLPLDPAHPSRRWAQVTGSAAARRALAGGAFVEPLEAAVHGVDVLALDELLVEEPGAGTLGTPNPIPGDADSAAYAIFTSGSTGAPKGAVVVHRGMVNHVWAKVLDLGLGSGDAVAQTASQCFDISVWQMLAPLVVGGRVEIYPDEVAHDPARLVEAVEADGVTVLETVPSLLRFVVEELVGREDERPGFARLRWLMPTGEALPPTLAAAWLGLYPRVPLVNAYGPTECSDDVSHHVVARPPAPGEVTVPIGRPVVNTGLHVLDPRLRPVPLGVPGELWVGGLGVGRGYLNDPRRTVGAWRPDPFSERPGERLYGTGDLVVRRPDGVLEFLHRIDHQVKIRGQRIELGEVEAVLERHPAVRRAVALAHRDGARDERRLVAYLVADEVSVDELRSFVAERLPEAMVPAGFARVDELPLTANGKVDRRALEALEVEATTDEAVYVPPRGPAEELLAGLWRELLGVERVGRHDDFFRLGGHSLLATRVIARTRELLAMDLPLRALFEAPTVAELAARVSRQATEVGGEPLPPLGPRAPREDGGAPPLSFAQQRLWFLAQLDPGSALYNMPFALRLGGGLDIGALGWALTALAARQEILRTTFRLVDDEPVQEIAPPAPVPLPLVDLVALPAGRREPEARRLAAREARLPFDLARPPVLRTALVRLADDDHVLFASLHHVSADGWSMEILTRELVELYRSRGEGRGARLPKLPVQYADYAVWQRSWLEGERLDAQLHFWRHHLDGAPVALDLPTDRPRPTVPTFRGAQVSRRVEPAAAEAVRELARLRGVTPYMVFLALYQALLARHAGASSVVVGTPIANRERVEVEHLIGFFANTLALRGDPAPGVPFVELLDQARETVLDASAHQDLPFERLVEVLDPVRDTSRAPLFQVMLVHQAVGAQAPAAGGLTLTPFTAPLSSVRFDLVLVVGERADGGLDLDLDYALDLFDRQTAEGLLERFVRLLDAAPAAPETAVGELPLLSAADQDQILAAWRDAPVLLGDGGDGGDDGAEHLHRLVETHAAAAPGAMALLEEGDGGRELTFGAMVEEAAALAEDLRAAGVVPGDRVAVCLERSADALVAFLAAQRAGAAFVPVDPDWPAERLGEVLADSRARAVVARPASRAVLARLAESAPEVTVVIPERRRADAAASPVVTLSPSAAAYVVYTSGSTGEAKGVEVSHRSVVAFVRGLGETVEMTADDRLLLFAPLTFDASVLQIFLALAWGASLVIHPEPRHLGDGEIVELASRRRLTVLDLPAARWRQWVRETATAERRLPASLRLYLTGGESVPRELVETWAGLVDARARFLSSYGPTETTVSATVFLASSDGGELDRSSAASAGAGRVIPIGRPLPGVRVAVVDPHLRPVPPGVVGELLLGGVGVARGYLGRPGATAEVFVPDPWAGGTESPGARAYRTGDLARRRSDGQLAFLGRVDDQIKIRGFRIEPAEVERALRADGDVAAAVVMVFEAAPGDRRLVAYLVATEDPQVAEADTLAPARLAQRLAGRLPRHMVPSAFVVLDALPVSASGKVDRRRLPAPGPDDVPGAGPGAAEGRQVPPRDDLERVLVDLWSEVLRTPVGVEDDFFAVGGHSLLATQLVGRLRSTFGMELALRDLFEAPTVAALARLLAADPEHGERIRATAEVMAQVASLSEDEMDALLGEERTAR